MIIARLFVIGCCLGCAMGAELQRRVELDPAVLDRLMQNERWAVIDAQGYAAKDQHHRAAVEFEKFTVNFPDSEMWGFAVYSGCWHLFQDRRYEAASERLRELIDIGEGLPEIPEARLLLGRCRLAAGDAQEAVAVLRELLETHPGSRAEVPARVLASRALLEQARLLGRAPEDVASARLELLGPLAEDIVYDEHNGEDLLNGLDQLQELVIASEDHARLVTLLESMVNARVTAPRGGLGKRPDHLTRVILELGADHGDAELVAKAAAIRWENPLARLLAMTDFHLHWSSRVLGHELDQVAAQRGQTPEELEAVISERNLELIESISGLIESGPDPEPRARAGWLLARLHFAEEGTWAAVETALDAGWAGKWSRERGYEAFTFALRHGIEADIASSVVARVQDEAEAQRLKLQILEYRAKQLGDRDAAQQAIVLLDAYAQDAEDGGVDFFYRMAALQREPLGDWDAAIQTYETINQPPRTDLAIAECLGEKGDWKGAFNRYGMVYAMSPGNSTGASALVTMGKIAHRHLGDRVRAITLLRQVCDDYPDTGQYSQAHVYLQHELGVTYTGGGGGKKAR